MSELLKRAAYTGVGIVAGASDVAQAKINELISKGKIEEAEGKKIVDAFIADVEAKKEEIETRLFNVVKKVVGGFNLPKQSELQALKDKIASLETDLLEATEPNVKKLVAKKTTSKKTTEEEEV